MLDKRSQGVYPPHLDQSLVGASLAMRRLKEMVARVAQSRSNVLVQGESGTGKEVIARSIHSLSPRATMPFIAENCAALPEGVVESELFGHVRGAFTGADRDRPGLIALADGGTLFLDEVGDLPPRIQAKLLRVIQEGEFRPVGGRELRRSDFRVIAATHRDLRAMAGRGEFREDLFYRLNVVGLNVPPLRDHLEDVPQLVGHILARLGPAAPAGAGRGGAGVSREAMEMLLRYAWPGNVRELQNVIEGGLVLSGGSILGVAELPERIVDNALAEPGPREPGDDSRSAGERVMIELALTRFQGDKTKAAGYIGWSRPRLYRRMRHHGIAIGFGGSPERKKGAPDGAPFS